MLAWEETGTFQVGPSKSWDKARAARLEAKRTCHFWVLQKRGACHSSPISVSGWRGPVIYNSLPDITKSEDADCQLSEGLEQPPAWSYFSRGPRSIDSLNLFLVSSVGGQDSWLLAGFQGAPARQRSINGLYHVVKNLELQSFP